MKFLMTIAALATIAASPAFAATPKHTIHQQSARDAYASYPAQDPYTVVVNGQYAGRDPDPSVRMNLERDPGLQAN
jgi:hypothetical protein